MYNFILGGVQFPVAPPSMNVTINGKNESVTLIDEGEINIIKKPGLSDIEFELLLPNQLYPFASYTNGFQPSEYYLNHIEKIMTEVDSNSKRIKPTSFIVNRLSRNNKILLFDTNFDVSVEGYTIEEDAENLGIDIKCTIKLKQYRAYGTKLLKVQSPATSSSATKVTVEKSRDTTNKVTKKTYTVKSGDTLTTIAKKQLGNSNKYVEIAKKNNISNPNKIYVGQVLQL